MRTHRLLTFGPGHMSIWVRLQIHLVGDVWAAMRVTDEVPPPGPGELKGTGF